MVQTQFLKSSLSSVAPPWCTYTVVRSQSRKDDFAFPLESGGKLDHSRSLLQLTRCPERQGGKDTSPGSEHLGSRRVFFLSVEIDRYYSRCLCSTSKACCGKREERAVESWLVFSFRERSKHSTGPFIDHAGGGWHSSMGTSPS